MLQKENLNAFPARQTCHILASQQAMKLNLFCNPASEVCPRLFAAILCTQKTYLA